MKLIIYSLSIWTLFAGCNNRKENQQGNIESDTISLSKSSMQYPDVQHHCSDAIVKATDWQRGFGLTHNPQVDSVWFKPVEYYVNDKNCSQLAIDFYYGTLRPTDNDTTKVLLNLVLTNNQKLRPFYRWCLDMTIAIQDGALAEYTGEPARRYAENFPEEFFQYIDADTTGQRSQSWIESISYSGFYKDDDYEHPELIRKSMAKTMKENSKDSGIGFHKRINDFAWKCFQ